MPAVSAPPNLLYRISTVGTALCERTDAIKNPKETDAMKFRTTLMFAAMFGVALPASATDLVIATVNNGQMIQMERLTSVFEKQNPDWTF
jgi:hypothetical protein